MARANSEKRDANLAAALVQLGEVLRDYIAVPSDRKGKFYDRITAIQEIAFQCVDEKQQEEFGESLIAIETFTTEGTPSQSQGEGTPVQQTGG